MKKLLFLILYFQFAVVSVYGAFKDVNWSARSSGMGGAFVAVADDASATLINPAGIMQVERGEADFMYTKLFTGLDNVDLALQYASVVHNLGKYGSMGVTWGYFDTKDVYAENTVAYTHAVNLANFCRNMPDVYLGANLKFLSHKYTTDQQTADDPVFAGGTSKWNMTADFGALAFPCPASAPGLSVGVAVRNVTQPDVGLDSRDTVPIEISGGAAYGVSDKKLFNVLTINDFICALDANYRQQEWGRLENKAWAGLGAECWMFNRSFALRAGGGTREASAGVSFRFKISGDYSVRFDYAVNFPFYLSETSGTHRGAFLVSF